MGMLDKTMLWMNDVAYNATPAVIDLGGAGYFEGRGVPLQGFIQCAAGDAADVVAVVVKTGSTTSPSTTVATIVTTAAKVNAGFRFSIPPESMLRYSTISLTSISAGTHITAGMAFDTQSNL